jgi:hypothetical protein
MLFLTVLTLLGQGQDMVSHPTRQGNISAAGAGGESDATHRGEIEPPNFR